MVHYVINGTKGVFNKKAICYGGLLYYKNEVKNIGDITGVEVEYPTISDALRTKMPKAVDLFYDWLVNDSMFAQAFKSKDFGVGKWFVMDPALESSYLLSAMITIRQPNEKSERVSLWYKLVSYGYCPNKAWILTNYFILRGDAMCAQPISGHGCVYAEKFTKKMCLNMLRGSYDNVHGRFVDIKTYHSPLCLCWGRFPMADDRLIVALDCWYNKNKTRDNIVKTAFGSTNSYHGVKLTEESVHSLFTTFDEFLGVYGGKINLPSHNRCMYL